MKIREKIPLATILIQITICLLTPMDAYLGTIILRSLIILGVGIIFWLKLVPAIKYEKIAAEAYSGFKKFSWNLVGLNEGSEKTMRSEFKAYTSLGLGAAIILVNIYFTYVFIDFFLHLDQTLNNFFKVTRIVGLIVFCFAFYLIIRDIRKYKKTRKKRFNENNISYICLLVMNMMVATILLIF